MKLLSIETTPNPNSMKLNVDGDLGAAVTYSKGETLKSPAFVEALLSITGINSVFACHNFVTINKDPRVDWANILPASTKLLGGKGLESEKDASSSDAQREQAAKDGQVHVTVQTFCGVPIQVKVEDVHSQKRISLGDRFNEAARAIQEARGADFLKERYWADYGIRYGTPDVVAQEIADEINGLFSEARLKRVVQTALGETPAAEEIEGIKPDASWLKDSDWQKRLAAVQHFSETSDSITQLSCALLDSNPQVRRLAAAALGASGSSEAVEALAKTVVNDENVGVRRTAGDALSDIGDVGAEPAMCQALNDKNKLVRWRAARFLFDIGTEEALPFLEKAATDPEFEVRMEVEAAIQRIQGKETGMGPAWKRIIDAQ